MKKYFPKAINNTNEFFKKLELEGKVRTLNSLEDLERQKSLNEACDKTRKDYLRMNAGSIISTREFYIL